MQVQDTRSWHMTEEAATSSQLRVRPWSCPLAPSSQLPSVRCKLLQRCESKVCVCPVCVGNRPLLFPFFIVRDSSANYVWLPMCCSEELPSMLVASYEVNCPLQFVWNCNFIFYCCMEPLFFLPRLRRVCASLNNILTSPKGCKSKGHYNSFRGQERRTQEKKFGES
jgi:hypothetical protein